jgi:hypothetical protein
MHNAGSILRDAVEKNGVTMIVPNLPDGFMQCRKKNLLMSEKILSVRIWCRTLPLPWCKFTFFSY